MPLIKINDLTDFAMAVLTAAGSDREQATGVAEVLVWSDAAGRPNQGVWRLPVLCKRLSAGSFNCPCHVRVDERTPAVALIDGDNGIGHYIGRIATDAAIARAAKHGVAAVAVRNSNFLGALGYYANRMAEQGMLAMMFSNSVPKVAPHGGTTPVFGTNPLAFAAPRRNGENIIVDLATAASAGSGITKAAELGLPLPVGIAIDRQGQPITDPMKVKDGALLPFGGAKGYTLGLVVEVLSGVVTGAGISHGVRSLYEDLKVPGNSGHFFFAVDVKTLMSMDAYYERMESLIEILRVDKGVLFPGEARWRALAEAKATGGVSLDAPSIAALGKLAQSLGVATPW